MVELVAIKKIGCHQIGQHFDIGRIHARALVRTKQAVYARSEDDEEKKDLIADRQGKSGYMTKDIPGRSSDTEQNEEKPKRSRGRPRKTKIEDSPFGIVASKSD